MHTSNSILTYIFYLSYRWPHSHMELVQHVSLEVSLLSVDGVLLDGTWKYLQPTWVMITLEILSLFLDLRDLQQLLL